MYVLLPENKYKFVSCNCNFLEVNENTNFQANKSIIVFGLFREKLTLRRAAAEKFIKLHIFSNKKKKKTTKNSIKLNKKEITCNDTKISDFESARFFVNNLNSSKSSFRDL